MKECCQTSQDKNSSGGHTAYKAEHPWKKNLRKAVNIAVWVILAVLGLGLVVVQFAGK